MATATPEAVAAAAEALQAAGKRVSTIAVQGHLGGGSFRGYTNIHAVKCTVCGIAHWNGTNRKTLAIRRHEKYALFYPLEDIIVP